MLQPTGQRVLPARRQIAVYTGLVPVAQNAGRDVDRARPRISHALLRHGAQRGQQKAGQVGRMAGAMSGMSQQSMQAVMAVYGYGHSFAVCAQQEMQADEFGLMLAAAACFNPQEAIPVVGVHGFAERGQAPPEFLRPSGGGERASKGSAGADAEGDGVSAEVLHDRGRSRQ